MSGTEGGREREGNGAGTLPVAGEGLYVPPGKMERRLGWIREILAPSAWAYLFLKLFVVDIDRLVLRALAPNLEWLLEFKILCFLVALSGASLLLDSKRFFANVAFFTFYPALVLLWRIPAVVVRQRNWSLVLGLLNAIVSFYRTAKYSLAVLTLYSISFAIILASSNRYLLWIASADLLILVLISYARQFVLIFRRSDVYQFHVRFFRGTRTFFRTMFVVEDGIRGQSLDSLDNKQVARWTSTLQHSVLFNRICLFWSKRLRDYQRSGFVSVSHSFVVLILLISSVLSFAFVNLGIYHAEPSQYAAAGQPGFFVFFWYSFNNMIFNGVDDIQPGGVIARTIYMIQTGCVFLMGLLFVSLLFSHRGQKHTEELDAAIAGLEDEGREMEGLIRTEYRLASMDEALEALRRSKASFWEFIFKLSSGL